MIMPSAEIFIDFPQRNTMADLWFYHIISECDFQFLKRFWTKAIEKLLQVTPSPGVTCNEKLLFTRSHRIIPVYNDSMELESDLYYEK